MELKDILSCYDTNEIRFKRLKKLYRNSKIIPFVGAGMSVPIYPQWSEVITKIMNGNKEEVDELNKLLADNKYEEACEYVKDKVKNNAFIDRVMTVFSADKIDECSEEKRKKVNANYLPEIFDGPIFTTNFDKLLEHCYRSGFKNIYSLSNMNRSWAVVYTAIREYEHNLYKIHGDIDDPNSWVFSKQQYDEIYGRKEFATVVETVCQNMNFLFMGCSLTKSDRYIKVLSDVVQDFSNKGILVRNFAFISLPDDENKTKEMIENEIETRDRFLSGIGIFPIWYPAGKHESIPILLKALKDKDVVVNEFKEDQTKKEKHFNLFSSNIHVAKAFVDDCFEYYSYDSSLNNSEANPTSFKKIVELAKNNDLLYIEGNYGSGKTVLLKRIQYELKRDYETLYFNVEDFYDNDNISILLKRLKYKCFVFIDGIDKLVDDSINLKLLDCFCEKIDSIIKNNKNISFIVNSRLYCRIDINNSDSGEPISLYVDMVMQRDNLIVVRTKGFLEKDQYERFFKNINPDFSNNNSLSGTTIKQWHKKSPLSCQVPLFAYAIGMYYYDKKKRKVINEQKGLPVLPDNKMIVYEEFVRKTIKGRFQEESIEGTINERLYDKYELLLRKIAIIMIHKFRENINYKEDVSQSQELSDKGVYAINVKTFDEEIQKQLNEVFYENRRKEVILSDAINNYFFCIYGSKTKNDLMVRFSDVNVMCCFAAAYIYDVISKIAEYEDCKSLEKDFEHLLNDLGMVELQPQVMDFLICKIHSLDKEVVEVLLNNILFCINKYNQMHSVSEENVRAMLVLYIIYIKFCNYSYKVIGALNLFKTFYRLCMTAKALNINGEHQEGEHRFLAERYFMDSTFIDCQFKRLNYKYYNFSKSRITHSHFEQCNFLDNEFIDAQIKNSTFRLCTIHTMIEKVTIDGLVEIENSIVDSVKFEGIRGSEIGGTIYFKGCTIINMVICDTTNRLLRIVFDNCIFNDIKIRRCKKIVVEVKDCVKKNKISLDFNSEIYSDDGEYFDRSVKALENLEDIF